jgi:two-component system phosphate regulon sensor histidine kinase PhoR
MQSLDFVSQQYRVSVLVGWKERRNNPMAEAGSAEEQIPDQHAGSDGDTAAGEKLLWSESRFRTLFEHSTDAIALLDEEGRRFYATPSSKRIVGYEPTDYMEQSTFINIHPDDLPHVLKAYRQLIEHPGQSTPIQYRVRHKNGSWVWIEGTGTNYLHEPAIQAIVVNYRDITERKLLEEEITKARDQLETIFQNVSDGITMLDIHGNVVYVNDAAAKSCGFSSANEMMGMPRETLQMVLRRFEMRDEQGKLLSFDQLPTRRVLQDEKFAQIVLQYRDLIRGTTFWSLLKSQPIYDALGNVQFVVNVVTDITERKELEQRKDEFISMASHELKTPITSVMGFTQILQKRFRKQGDDQSLHFLDRMNTQLTKLTDLINSLLDISKMQAGELTYQNEPFDLDGLVRETIEIVQAATYTHRILLVESVKVSVFGDQDRLAQVLTNLLTNAIKYSPGADKVIVCVTIDGDNAVVSVQDFGIGIAREHQQRIFDRFYQAADPERRTFSGLGIGLYISHEIIKRHAGRIWVESKKGQGSVFRFSIPLYKGELSSQKSNRTAESEKE